MRHAVFYSAALFATATPTVEGINRRYLTMILALRRVLPFSDFAMTSGMDTGLRFPEVNTMEILFRDDVTKSVRNNHARLLQSPVSHGSMGLHSGAKQMRTSHILFRNSPLGLRHLEGYWRMQLDVAKRGCPRTDQTGQMEWAAMDLTTFLSRDLGQKDVKIYKGGCAEKNPKFCNNDGVYSATSDAIFDCNKQYREPHLHHRAEYVPTYMALSRRADCHLWDANWFEADAKPWTGTPAWSNAFWETHKLPTKVHKDPYCLWEHVGHVRTPKLVNGFIPFVAHDCLNMEPFAKFVE